VRRGLLVAHVDNSDPLSNTPIGQWQDVTTSEHEYRVNAFCFERSGDHLPAVDFRHVVSRIVSLLAANITAIAVR
jgi:hypothetical protein